jgi:hypothetical protein
MIEVQVVRDLVNDIKAMQKAGFESKAVFEDYFMLPDGELRDIVHLVYTLKRHEEEF